MIELIVLVGMIIGGMEIDKTPVEKIPVVKTVFKKAYHFTVEEQAADLKQMEINSVLRQLENGKDVLKRCPVNKTCTKISELKEIL